MLGLILVIKAVIIDALTFDFKKQHIYTTEELKRDIIQMCCENVRKKCIPCSTQVERPILKDI